jgi:hypothetical protein
MSKNYDIRLQKAFQDVVTILEPFTDKERARIVRAALVMLKGIIPAPAPQTKEKE